MGIILTKESLARLKAIHKLSSRYNGPAKKKHLQKLFLLAKEHMKEIVLLRKQHDAHYLVEVGDLLILCFEILLENKKDVEQMMSLCFARYERKLNQLMAEEL